MARFYFDAEIEGALFQDEEGQALQDRNAARDEVVLALSEMARPAGKRRRPEQVRLPRAGRDRKAGPHGKPVPGGGVGGTGRAAGLTDTRQ
jgi:hypothetical protein